MGSQKPITTKGGLPKKGRACTVCKFKGGLARKRVGVFEGGWHPNAHEGATGKVNFWQVTADCSSSRWNNYEENKGFDRFSWFL